MAYRICLIDGTYELFRAFYSTRTLTSPEGREVGACYQLGRSLLALVKSGHFTHYAVAFDTVIESFRNQLFAGYKTSEGIEPVLFEQFALAEEVARGLGFRVLSMVEFEADDALATLAHRFGADDRVEQVVVASPDKDLMQCVRGARVITWDRMREVEYDEAAVRAKHGVGATSIPDFLALVGDTADGIPGVPRWGKKSAADVLETFQFLERIPSDVGLWPNVRGKASLSESLEQHRTEANLYKVLATLRTDVPLGEGLEDLVLATDDSALLRIEGLLGRSFRPNRVE